MINLQGINLYLIVLNPYLLKFTLVWVTNEIRSRHVH